MTPIEQSIKRKIESVGVPLKDWDIQINYGIKTGYNDAFIITRTKRDEILANCKTEEERSRTDEIIRPILRGRDIKRYGYEWANLYLIATFPARHYNIDSFPSVKKYLLSFAYDSLLENGNDWVAKNYLAEFCKQKLEQTGQEIVINGKYVLDPQGHKEKSRKRTNNQWFETQDSISYWEDFFRPKILYPDIMRLPRNKEKMDKYPYFYYDTKNFFPEATLFLMVGDQLSQVYDFLCSEIGFFIFSKYYMGPVFDSTGFRYKKDYLCNLPVPKVKVDSSGAEDYEIKLSELLGLSREEMDYIHQYKDNLLL